MLLLQINYVQTIVLKSQSLHVLEVFIVRKKPAVSDRPVSMLLSVQMRDILMFETVQLVQVVNFVPERDKHLKLATVQTVIGVIPE